MKKKKLVISIVVIVLILAVVGVNAAKNFKKEEAETEVIKKQISVQDIALQSEVSSKLLASGSVVPQEYSLVRSLTSGTVESIVPVGTQVFKGQALFSVRDAAVESSYFNSLQNLERTNSITLQRVQQAELALNSAKARLDLARASLSNTQAQADQTFSSTLDSAVVTYNSSYNTLTQVFNFLSTASIDEFQYKYADIFTSQSSLRNDTNTLYSAAAGRYLTLAPVATRDNVQNYLNQMQGALQDAKVVVDNSAVILQTAIPGGSFSEGSINTDKSLMASYQTSINTNVSSVINSLNSIENTRISNRLSVDNAQNQADLAEIEYSNSTIALENAKQSAGIEQNAAQSQFDSAAYSFTNLQIPAPFSGTVISHLISPGEQTSPGKEMLELGNLTISEITVDIDSSLAGAIVLGAPVIIDGEIEGLVSEIEPVGDLISGKTKVIVQSDDERLAPKIGKLAEVEFNLTYSDLNQIIVPIKSVTIESGGNYVFVLDENNVVERRSVNLGQVYGDKVSVTSGLSEGDRLVLLNGVFVAVGDEVEVLEEN